MNHDAAAACKNHFLSPLIIFAPFSSKNWWDQLGVVYYEQLKQSETVTGDRYRTQLMRLSRALKGKRPEYQERHDYSTIIPFDFHLFPSIADGLAH